MSDKLRFHIADSLDPYRNLAVESYLTESVRPDERILYLWQNQNTVVIGRNQNAYQECRIDTLTADGGHLARRLSGGGAVFHDTGNLNFSFIAPGALYNVDTQLQVLIRALSYFSLHAKKSGRNDLLLSGRKFSGNAFLKRNGHSCHHGTVMLSVDTEKLQKYLTPDKEKLQKHLEKEAGAAAGKSVPSVRSRVVNLRELEPGLTAEALKEKLILAFCEVYGGEALPLRKERLPEGEIQKRQAFFRDPEWILGRKIAFTKRLYRRFPSGALELVLNVKDGEVKDAFLYTDSLAEEAQELAKVLIGKACTKEALSAALEAVTDEALQELRKDLLSLIREEL